jgi:polyferredoxin
LPGIVVALPAWLGIFVPWAIFAVFFFASRRSRERRPARHVAGRRKVLAHVLVPVVTLGTGILAASAGASFVVTFAIIFVAVAALGLVLRRGLEKPEG